MMLMLPTPARKPTAPVPTFSGSSCRDVSDVLTQVHHEVLRRHRSAIFHRRLTAQEPLRGHRVVAARLSKVP